MKNGHSIVTFLTGQSVLPKMKKYVEVPYAQALMTLYPDKILRDKCHLKDLDTLPFKVTVTRTAENLDYPLDIFNNPLGLFHVTQERQGRNRRLVPPLKGRGICIFGSLSPISLCSLHLHLLHPHLLWV